MKRFVLLLLVFCSFVTIVSGQTTTTPEQDRYVTIYRGAEPYTAQFQAVTKSDPTTTKTDVEKTIASYPEPMRPWKTNDLKGVKILLPLGEGESIDDKLYRFTVVWNEATDEPLRINDLNFNDHSPTALRTKNELGGDRA